MSLEIFRATTLSPLGMRRHLLFHWNGRWAEASPLPEWNQETFDDLLTYLKKIPSVITLLSTPAPFPSLELPLWFLQRPYNPKPLQSAFLFLGGALPNPLPTHVKLKNPEHLPLFSSPVRLRFDCQGRSIDPHLLLPYRDRIDYIEDCPHPISLPAASDRLGHKSICIHKPTVKGIPPYSNSRTILSSSFESDLGLCQIAALAHALDLAHEVHGIGTLHLTQNLLLREKATFHAGYFTPPSRLEPQNLHYIHTIL